MKRERGRRFQVSSKEGIDYAWPGLQKAFILRLFHEIFEFLSEPRESRRGVVMKAKSKWKSKFFQLSTYLLLTAA